MNDRSTYTEKAISQFEDLNAEIKRHEAAEDERLSAAAEIKRRERKKIVRQKQAAVEDYIRHLQQATGDAWETARAGFEKSLDELRKLFTKDQKEH